MRPPKSLIQNVHIVHNMSNKASFGIRLETEIAEKLNKLVDELKEIKANRSEIVETIVSAYLKANVKHFDKTKELVMRKRKGELWVEKL